MRTIQVVCLMYKITPSFVMRTGNPPLRFIIWLNHWAGKMKGIARSQWLPEPILPARDLPGCFPKKIFVWVHKNAKVNLVDIHSSLIGNLSSDDGKRQCKRHCSDSDFIALIPNPNLSIGRFRVPKILTFKMKLGAQPFLWKWVLFTREWKMIPYQRLSTYPRFETEAQGNSEMAYCWVVTCFHPPNSHFPLSGSHKTFHFSYTIFDCVLKFLFIKV